MQSKTTFPKDKINVLLLEGVHPSAIKLFNEAGYQRVESVSKALTETELLSKISNTHILGIRSKTQLTKNVLDAAQKLIAAGCFCIGTNQVNMISATNNGVAVFNSPFSNTRSVAELVIAYSIMLLRRIPEKNDGAHKGLWLKDASSSFEVRGKTIGIIGYGHIGSQVSVLAESIGMKVIFYDVEPKLSLGNATPIKQLDELLKKSDIITLHVPGGKETANFLNVQRISKIKKGAALINLSRGEVVDLETASKAIASKQLSGMAVDVFPDEPESNQQKFISVLQNLPNVILTPHIGGSTVEAQENIGVDVATKLINYLNTGSSVGSLSVPPLNLPMQQSGYRILHIHKNQPGVLSEINSVVSGKDINILSQYLNTNAHIGYVVFDIEKRLTNKIMEELKNVSGTIRVRSLV
jgi:D-3-phosphoglycerate dehydrogenase